MSNLIKSVYFNNLSEGKKCLIDSDSRIESYIPEIYSQPGEEEDFEKFQFRQLSGGDGMDGMPEGGEAQFTGGLNVINMEDVLDEERQKLSEEAAAMGESVIAQARQEADAIIADARNEAEGIRNQAYEEGKAQGMEEGTRQAQGMLESQRAEMQAEYNRRFQELKEQEENLEPHFAEILAGLVQKITGVLCEDKKDVITYLIDNALNNLESTKKIVLRVSRDDIAAVSEKRSDFVRGVKAGTEFEIMEDSSLSANQCIIETDNKIIDCSLDAQLDSLCDQIRMLAL